MSLIQRWDRRKGPESSLETGGWPDLAGVSGKGENGAEQKEEGNNRPILHRNVFDLVLKTLCRSHKAASFAEEEEFLSPPLKAFIIQSGMTAEPTR